MIVGAELQSGGMPRTPKASPARLPVCYVAKRRTACTSEPLSAASVNPARGNLFIEARPHNISQTPSGVTCGPSPLLFHRKRADRSPLAGFARVIARAGCYKQVTPSGVVGQDAADRENACKVQVLRRFGLEFVNRRGL
jgi:hypothetical protein